jgi:predicted phosphodiesterase
MAKISIINDTHYCARKSSKLFQDYFELFYKNVFFPTLEKLNIDTVLHLGDAFDNRRIIEFDGLDWTQRVVLEPLSKYNVHMIVGNHDIFLRNTTRLNSPELLLQQYNNIKVYREPVEINVHGLDIFMIPWITPETEELTYSMMSKTKAKVAMGHLELNGFVAHKGHVMEDSRDPDPFYKFKKVLSGHYHTRSDNGKIYYLGNPYEIYFNDVDDLKGFTIFDTETLEHEHVNNPYKLHYNLSYDEDNIIIPKDLENKIVRVVVKNKKTVRKFEKYIEKINNQNPYELKVIENIETPDIENMGEIESEDTISILNSYIEESDISLDKSKLKNIINDLYKSAMDLI